MFYTLAIKTEKSCPVFIDGVLSESFYPGVYDEGMSGSWYYSEPGEPLALLPEKLLLITKDKGYDFDFRTAFEGHIVSEQFLSIFKTLKTGEWETAEISIVNPKGESVPAKKYYFIRQVMSEQETPAVIDFDKSNINYRKSGEIKNVIALAIKDDVKLDFFSIFEISLLGYTFVSSDAAEAFLKYEMKGFELVSTEKIGTVRRA